ncbi:MAG TPA: hypothetical protein VFL62_25745 [Bradyrhizobium sp.]|uniref:hypothetical protein n=1 Tax=Bradyrhizobium sp. TaxID=376 RepID=UPI002D8001C6|nr:hypothetical protein [Bradyrhizobium sp.]HET7889648.1 hypothetical protein [Bradyrhizobium sp.]
MKKLLLCAMLVAAATPAWSQTKPKAVAGRDPCAPIGQTANRELVYPMGCNNLPAPPPLPPQAEVQQAPAPAPEPEARRSGLFGMSFDFSGGTTQSGQGRTP